MGSIRICPNCAKRLPGDLLVCACGYAVIIEESAQVSRLVADVPLWVRLLHRLSTPQDIGLGATVKRIAARFGGERFKKLSAKIGLPCGCTDQEIEWNRLYPNPHYRSE